MTTTNNNESPSPSRPTSAKTVYLIRHAHSQENERVGSFLTCFSDLSRFSLPKSSDVSNSLELLNMEPDAPLSAVGVKQCEIMKNMLKENDFVAANKIELVVHSTLQRARVTCEEMIGCSTDESMEDENNPDKKKGQETSSYPKPIQRVVATSLLEEKHPLEWVPGNTAAFETRLAEFQKWLAEQPESVVCVVGHSQYFKRMLELPFKFDNTDVYCIQFDPNKTTPNEPMLVEKNGTPDTVTLKPQWHDMKLLHTYRNAPSNC